MDIHRDQLLRLLGPNRGDRSQEINEFLSMIPLSVEKVETVFDFFTVYRLAIDIVEIKTEAIEPTYLWCLYEPSVSG